MHFSKKTAYAFLDDLAQVESKCFFISVMFLYDDGDGDGDGEVENFGNLIFHDVPSRNIHLSRSFTISMVTKSTQQPGPTPS